MAIGGQGLARLDNFAVFVDQTVPQDRVLARITKKKKSWAQARVLEMLVAQPFACDAALPVQRIMRRVQMAVSWL